MHLLPPLVLLSMVHDGCSCALITSVTLSTFNYVGFLIHEANEPLVHLTAGRGNEAGKADLVSHTQCCFSCFHVSQLECKE